MKKYFLAILLVLCLVVPVMAKSIGDIDLDKLNIHIYIEKTFTKPNIYTIIHKYPDENIQVVQITHHGNYWIKILRYVKNGELFIYNQVKDSQYEREIDILEGYRKSIIKYLNSFRGKNEKIFVDCFIN